MSYPREIIQRVWEKGIVVKGYNPDVLRKDEMGAWIIRDHFGTQNSEYSWEIDILSFSSTPSLKEIENLRPLQWENKIFKDTGEKASYVTSYNTSNVVMR